MRKRFVPHHSPKIKEKLKLENFMEYDGIHSIVFCEIQTI